MKNLIVIICSLILISSCKKNQDLTNLKRTPEIIDITKSDSLDFNSDHIIDFVISFKELATHDVPSSEGSIIGSLIPMNHNQLLYQNNVGYLFLNINDTIRKTSNGNLNWYEYDADLISKNRENQDRDTTWTVISEQNQLYILAYKINSNDSDIIGWASLEFDIETGEISITNGDNSDSDELIIHL